MSSHLAHLLDWDILFAHLDQLMDGDTKMKLKIGERCKRIHSLAVVSRRPYLQQYMCPQIVESRDVEADGSSCGIVSEKFFPNKKKAFALRSIETDAGSRFWETLDRTILEFQASRKLDADARPLTNQEMDAIDNFCKQRTDSLLPVNLNRHATQKSYKDWFILSRNEAIILWLIEEDALEKIIEMDRAGLLDVHAFLTDSHGGQAIGQGSTFLFDYHILPLYVALNYQKALLCRGQKAVREGRCYAPDCDFITNLPAIRALIPDDPEALVPQEALKKLFRAYVCYRSLLTCKNIDRDIGLGPEGRFITSYIRVLNKNEGP